MMEAEIDRTLEKNEALIHQIATRYDLPPIRVDEVADLMLRGVGIKGINEAIAMNIDVAQEYPNDNAEDERTTYRHLDEIIHDLGKIEV